jgi:hypothetical protein
LTSSQSVGIAAAAAQGMSSRVYFAPNGQLQYQPDDQGKQIMDYSSAGYSGGGVAIPDVAVSDPR